MAPTGDSGPRWIWPLCGAVIIAAVTSAIVILFLFPTPSIVQYRLTVSLLCFALSSVAGLLFAANVEIKGSVGKLSLTLAGPAALWVATLIIFGTIFPETSLPRGKAYDLRLNLIFPEADPANPFNATIHAFVQKQGNAVEQIQEANLVRGVGGIVVYLDRISEGDKIYLVADDEGRHWRSNDMIAPNAHLQMNKMRSEPR
jgi:hypothetical protein